MEGSVLRASLPASYVQKLSLMAYTPPIAPRKSADLPVTLVTTYSAACSFLASALAPSRNPEDVFCARGQRGKTENPWDCRVTFCALTSSSSLSCRLCEAVCALEASKTNVRFPSPQEHPDTAVNLGAWKEVTKILDCAPTQDSLTIDVIDFCTCECVCVHLRARVCFKASVCASVFPVKGQN